MNHTGLEFPSPVFATHDTSRLPSYRPSHLARYHPYPRMTPSLFDRLMAGDEFNPYEHTRPAARRSSFALTTDILENAEIEIVVEASSVKLFVEQFTARNRKFRIVADYFAPYTARRTTRSSGR
ncbi:hypothetical protein OF83DRAFT_718724 [Amylostereum chailletii]|nr:hypothetical protein OF83DRAFT_718724 [Amylostereum chailletii]